MGKPIYISVEKVLLFSKDKVWQAVALDYGNVANYHPAVKASNYHTEQRSGVGTMRHCDTSDGGFLLERIVEWNEGNSFLLQLEDSSYPMALIKSKFTFVEVNGNQSKLKQEFWYRFKPPMGWMSFLMKGKMKKTIEQGFEGLTTYLNEK